MHGTIVRITVALAASLIVPPPAAAQSDQKRPIDRWLVAVVQPDIASSEPLSGDGGREFPDRDRTVGPGYWTLVREDRRERFHFGDVPLDGRPGATLAHTYIKSPRDATFGLAIDPGACGTMSAWLNGQLLPGTGEETTVRLAGGWNTLLVALPASARCAPELAVLLSGPEALTLKDESALDVSRLRIQASRPPGVRSNQPAGMLQVSAPTPTRLIWRAGTNDLVAAVEYTLTSWGAGGGLDLTPEEDGRPTGVPTVDLTGDWTITFFTPTGIQTLDAEFAMTDDGELTGRLTGERLDGDIRDGWVSGDEFGWTMRVPGRGRSLEIQIRGVLTDGMMSGDLDFGGFRGFESRFEGERAAQDTASSQEDERVDAPASADAPAGAEALPEVDPSPDLPDPDGQRARIVRQLLPPTPPAARAPTSGAVELSIGGRKITGEVGTLEPVQAAVLEGEVEFGRVRNAALDESGVKATVKWGDDERKFVGRVPAATLLEAFHAPITFEGWATVNSDRRAGTFRIPDRLDGFTLRGLDGDWTVGGQDVADRILCSPCRKGVRLDISVAGTSTPQVTILEAGFPASKGRADAPSAESWLEALKGDNEDYRDLGRRFGYSSRAGSAGSDAPSVTGSDVSAGGGLAAVSVGGGDN